MSTGQGFGYSLFGNSIKSNDVTAINNYANALKNGASVGEAWRTTMTGTSVAAKQYVLDARKAGKSTAELTQGLNNMTLGAKASTVAMKALAVAKNIALNIGVMLLITGIAKGIDYLIHRTEKMQEALQNSVDEFNTVTDELKTLEEELKTTTERLEELQRLADNGTISVAEEAELETLKKTNKELARKVALKQQEQAQEARDVLKDSKKNTDTKVKSKYLTVTNRPDVEKMVTPAEELESAIWMYSWYSKNGEDAYAKDAQDRIEEMYALISPTIEAYEDLMNAGIELEDEDKTRYEQLKKSQDAYLAYIYTLNGTREAFEGLNAEQQRNVLLNKLIKQGLSEDIAKAIIGSISDEDLDMYWDKNFSFVPPEMKDGETAEEYGKRYAEAWAKGLEEGVKNTDKITGLLSDMKSASENISALSSAFKQLSDDGYMSTESMSKIQEATKLSGDEWEEYQTKLMRAKKGSSEFNQVLSDLTYKILDATFKKDGLVNATEEEIAAVLRENNISNASAVAHDYLARTISSEEKAKAENSIRTRLLSGDIAGLIENLSSEATACGITETAFKNLAIQMVLTNETSMSFDDQIANLKALGVAAEITAAKIAGVNGYRNTKYSEKRNARGNMDSRGGLIVDVGQETINGSTYIVYYGENGQVVDKEKIGVDYDNITTPKIPTYTNDGKSDSDKTPFDDSYYSTLDAWLEENQKEIDKLEKEREALNRQFENALDTGNKEQAEILRNKLAENAKAQKDILHKQNEAHRITQKDLLKSLYQYAPSLSGKSWDEISEVDLVNIENELNNKSEMASDDDKNQAKYNLNQFKGIVDDLKNLNKTIEENSDAWWEADENAKGYWQSQIDFQDEYSNNWIDNQKAFDKLSEKEELAAYGRMINNNKEFQKQILNDTSLSEESKLALIRETNDKIVEIEKNAYDLRKSIFGDASDFGSSYYDSQKTLLQSYFDVTNSIAEAQHEINKELETSKTMYEWLDEDTRKLLFNQEDYNILCKELNEIQGKADILQRQYEDALENSTLNTIEEITSQYEMQYETLMKSYEIAKADLEIAKKKAKLNNVLNERKVRMFINGQWQWVANTQDVIDAKSELADAEYARKTSEAGLKQTESINELTAKQDKLGTVISKFENGVITLDDAIKQIVSKFRDLPNAVLNNLSSIKTTSSSSSGKTSSGRVLQVNSNGNAPAGAKIGDIIKTAGGDYKIVSAGTAGATYNPSSKHWSIKVDDEYASGTASTISGWSLMGEKKDELFINANGHLIPINQPTVGNLNAGGIVFNQEQMASARAIWDMTNIGKVDYSHLKDRSIPQNIDNSNCNNVIINGLTVDSGSADGQALINALRRYVGNH